MTMVLTVFAEELIKKDIKQLYSVQIYHCVSQGPDNVMGSDCDLLAAVRFAISVTLIIQTRSDT